MALARRALTSRPTRRLALALLLCFGVTAYTVAFAAPTAHAWTRGYDTIILVHGFSGSNSSGSGNGDDCLATWGSAIDYLRHGHSVNGQTLTWQRQDFRTIKFYNGDTNCGRSDQYNNYTDSTEDLHNSRYTQHCSSYYPEGTNASQDGTNNESLYHVSCLFAWYLYLNFGNSGWNVELVAHSMGGLIVRNTIYQIWKSKATGTMPPSLPNISDVATFSTPHGGVYGASVTCFGCTQGKDMEPSGAFMNEMYNQAQNPQSGGTDWTMMGSACDPFVSTSSATYMSGGHKSYFASGSPNSCYDHGSILADESDSADAHIYWCDGCGVSPSSWNYWGGAPHSLHHMFYALWLTNW